MNSLFGEIRQLGFVTRDVDRSIRYFLDAWNIGPWYVSRNIKASSFYKGVWTEPEITLALSHCGGLQFELIQQHNDASSAYRDAILGTSSLHVQHVAVWIDAFADMKSMALARGWNAVLETSPGPGESCYVVHPDEPMVCLEISDRSPFKEQVRDTIRDIALAWDGSDPIREGLPT